ncbi:hypothetical protein Tco_0443521 [Tanacetum coccineum]
MLLDAKTVPGTHAYRTSVESSLNGCKIKEGAIIHDSVDGSTSLKLEIYHTIRLATKKHLNAVKGSFDGIHAGCQDNKSAAISSTEAEYIALSGCSVRSSPFGMRSQSSIPTMAFGFNKIPIPSGSLHHGAMWRIGVIELYFVNTEYQLVDIFTKALGRERIEFLINKLGMRSFTPDTLKQLADEVDEFPPFGSSHMTLDLLYNKLMEISIADQIALDDALVAPADRLKIVGNKKFEEPPLEKEILAFLASLGHSGEIRKITDVNLKSYGVNSDYALKDDVFTTIKVHLKGMRCSLHVSYGRDQEHAVNQMPTHESPYRSRKRKRVCGQMGVSLKLRVRTGIFLRLVWLPMKELFFHKGFPMHLDYDSRMISLGNQAFDLQTKSGRDLLLGTQTNKSDYAVALSSILASVDQLSSKFKMQDRMQWIRNERKVSEGISQKEGTSRQKFSPQKSEVSYRINLESEEKDQIDNLLKERRLMRSLEKFVGGKLYEGDPTAATKEPYDSII